MKVAILGTWHVHTKEYTTGVLNNPNAEVAVVWDNDAERGKKFAEEMNLPFNADLDAVLGDESIDSVVICTATCDHPEIMMKVTAAKKNIPDIWSGISRIVVCRNKVSPLKPWHVFKRNNGRDERKNERIHNPARLTRERQSPSVNTVEVIEVVFSHVAEFQFHVFQFLFIFFQQDSLPILNEPLAGETVTIDSLPVKVLVKRVVGVNFLLQGVFHNEDGLTFVIASVHVRNTEETQTTQV